MEMKAEIAKAQRLMDFGEVDVQLPGGRKESEERSIPVCGNVFPRLGEVYLYSNMKILLSFS